MKNFVNDLAFKDALTTLATNDTILVRDTSNSKKNTEIIYSDLLTAISANIVSAYTTKTADYTIVATDNIIECTANSFTITLPTAIGVKGKQYIVSNSGVGTITIDAFSTQTIQGDLTQLIYTDESFTLVSDGANWKVI